MGKHFVLCGKTESSMWKNFRRTVAKVDLYAVKSDLYAVKPDL